MAMAGQPTRGPIGPHLPLGNGLQRAAARAEQLGVETIQIFTDNPTAWRRRTDLPADLPAFRERVAAAGIKSIAVHAPYLVNLCGGNDDFWAKSVATMTNELLVGAQYQAQFVVMHIGSHVGIDREQGIERLARGLKDVLDGAHAQSDGADIPMLVLETAAGAGDGIGATIDDLADIWSAAEVAGVNVDRLGICLDTAHLWGAGFDVSTDLGIDHLESRVDALIGRDRVVMVHLNDSRTTLGSRLDRHEHIAAGQIGPAGMRAILDHPWLAGLPTYLETPGMDLGYDQVNLDRVRMLIDGHTPPQLPEEAFSMRGSRTRSAPPGT
jgi:deoxyribonuclease-4